MSDLFPMLPDPDPPRFDDAVREAVERLEAAVNEFETLLAEVPEERFSDEEWQVVERTASEIEKAAEMAEDGYVAVAYDGHAWYRILENLERVGRRLESAIGVIRVVRDRRDQPPPPPCRPAGT